MKFYVYKVTAQFGEDFYKFLGECEIEPSHTKLEVFNEFYNAINIKLDPVKFYFNDQYFQITLHNVGVGLQSDEKEQRYVLQLADICDETYRGDK